MRTPLTESDWAPGDRWIRERDWSALTLHTPRSPADADFARAYERLRSAFGATGMELREVIASRLAWDPRQPPAALPLAYEMHVLRFDGRIVAVRDHNVALTPDAALAVVHLSHALVEADQRGRGLGGWLRATPVETARRVLARVGARVDTPIVLVAEMEPLDRRDPLSVRRLRTYSRAGFLKLDPTVTPYAQPDFRPEAAIQRDRPRAVPYTLVLRRVGREHEPSMPADEVAAVVDALYAIYAEHVCAEAVAPLREAAARWTRAQRDFALRDPLDAR